MLHCPPEVDMQQQLLSSKNENWCTPSEILDRVRQIAPIVLDPCSNQHSTVNATTTFSLTQNKDGLVESWNLGGLVYVNPPYGRKLPKWIAKTASEALQGVEIVLLVPARTDTKWFHRFILPFATSILFLEGRLKFVNGLTGQVESSATFPSMIVYYGENKETFKAAFAGMGFIVNVR